MGGTSITSTAASVARQSKAPATGFKVNPLGSFDLKIGEKPVQIKASEDVTINIFPRKGNLLLLSQAKVKNSRLQFILNLNPQTPLVLILIEEDKQK